MSEIKKRMKDNALVREEVVAAVVAPEEPKQESEVKREKPPIRLNLGCGWRKVAGCVNIDNRELVKPDLLHDITKPFPYEDASVDYILATDIIEHIPPDDVAPFLWEMHRILKPDGVLEFSIPSTDSRGAFMDPTHRSYWNINSWLYYTDREWHALYPDLPLFRKIEIKDEVTSARFNIIHTRGKVSPMR